MQARVSLHMEFVVASALQLQAADSGIHTIFAGPFVTHIIQSMGLLGCVHHSTPVGGQSPFKVRSMQKMGVAIPL